MDKYGLFRSRGLSMLGPYAVFIAFTPLLAATTRAGEPADLRVMSFNIRYSTGGNDEQAAENNWTDPDHPRRERVIRVIRENLPDVLGVQEARHLQVQDLQAALTEFEFYGIGRDDGKTGGEFSGIFYSKERFTRRDAGSFWLSATPEMPGTSFYLAPNAVPRIASWVRLVDRRSQHEFFVLNMHWDHVDADARRQSARLVRERLADLAAGLPSIVTGDLNAGENSAEVTALRGETNAPGRPLADSYRELHPERRPNEATFGGWQGVTDGRRIDFILHTSELTASAAEILRTQYDGRWPSDHYPVTATLRLNTGK